MDCEKIGKILDEYIGGELAGADTRLADAHLRNCPACAAEERRRRRALALAAAYGRESAPPGFEAAVRMKIEAEKSHRRSARSTPFIPRWAAAAAAFALVILAGAYLQFFHSTTGIKIKNADKTGGLAAEKYKTPETGLPKTTTGENLRATAPSDAKRRETPGAPVVTGKPAAEPPMPAEETVSTAAAQTGFKGDSDSAGDVGSTRRSKRRSIIRFKRDSDSAGGAGGSEKADFNAPRAAVVKTALETIPMTEEAKEVEKAIAERENRETAVTPQPLAKSAPTAATGITSAEVAGEAAAEKKERDKKAKIVAPTGEAQPVALGGYGARQAPFDMIALRPLNPSDKEYGRLGGAENVFIGDLPGSESLIMSLDGGHAAGAAPAGVGGAAPEVRNVAHAADTFAVESPAAAAARCEKIVSEFLAARGAAAAQWQRTGGRVVVRGPFGALRALRIEIMREYSPGEAAGFAAAEEKALKAVTDAKGKPIYKIADDTLAVLEIRFVQK